MSFAGTWVAEEKGMLHRFVAALILFPVALCAQQPTPPPDYKALYEQANDAAAKWKEFASAREQENKELQHRLEVYQNNYREMMVANEAKEHFRQMDGGISPRQIAENEKQALVTKRFTLAPKHHVHLIEYGGPNEFMTFLGADPLAIHLRIGVGEGKPVDVPLRRSFQGTASNRTEVYVDGVGCAVYYVDDIKTPAGCGTFEAEFRKDALYRQQAEKSQKNQTDGVGTISHYSGQ